MPATVSRLALRSPRAIVGRLIAAGLLGTATLALGGAFGDAFQLTETAEAQQRGRGGGGGGWGGGLRGGMGGMQDIRELLQPDFVRRDVPLFVDQLQLDDVQQIVIETLFEDYEKAYSEQSGGVQEQLQDMGRQMMQSFVTPDMRERMQERMQGAREEMRRMMEENPDMTQEERREFFRDYMTRMQDEMAEERAASGADAAVRESMGEIFSKLEQWSREKESMRNALVEGVKAQLNDDQLAAWDSFDRFLTREKSLPKARISGESTNLFLALDEAQLSDAAFDAVETMFDDYEVRLHEALVARDRYLETSAPQMYKALQESNVDRAEQIMRRQVDLRRAVRDVNDEYRKSMVAAMYEVDEAAAASFDRLALERSYQRATRPTRATRSIEAALEMELPTETREAIEALAVEYATVDDGFTRRLITEMRKTEPEQQVEQINRMVAMIDGDFRGAFERRGGDDDPMRDIREQRDTTSDQFIDRLRAMLTPEQAEALPGQRGQRGQRGGQRGEFSMDDLPENVRERLVERFDRDGDGQLSEAEQAEIRERFQRGRGGGGGGQRGGGGGGN